MNPRFRFFLVTFLAAYITALCLFPAFQLFEELVNYTYGS